MTQFAKIYMADGTIKTIGSLPGERLDINYSGAYVTLGRGNQAHLKEHMSDISKIVFINNHEGPDIEMTVRLMPADERRRIIEEIKP